VTTITEVIIDEENPVNLKTIITDIDGNWVTGRIEGTINTSSGEQDLSGKFKIYDK